MRSRSKTAKEIEAAAERKPEIIQQPQAVFSTGSTELNLACSDSIMAAFPYGIIVNIAGDTHAGKTYLAHSILNEAALEKDFGEYDLIYDNAEAANTIGIAKMFSKALVNRMKLPRTGERSSNVHDFKINVWKLLRENKPFIYILDSLDSLSTREAEKQLDAATDGKDEKGSYGMEKPKVLSNILGPISRKLESTNSLLIILSQTRDNINPFSFNEKTRSGGKALDFYSSYIMWLALAEKHRKKIGNVERTIGHCTKIRIKKNKLTGKVREAELNIYVDYGIDDIGTCIDFLTDHNFWEKRKNTIIAADLNLEGTKDKLIRQIEDKNLEMRLRRVMGKAWKSIEDSFKLNRKKKYQ